SEWERQLEATRAISANERLTRGGIRAAFGPHATDTVSDELFARIGQESRKENIPVHFHLAQSAEEMEAPIQKGLANAPVDRVSRTLADCSVLIAHGLYLTRTECEALAQRRWVLRYCPFSQLQFGILSPFASWL